MNNPGDYDADEGDTPGVCLVCWKEECECPPEPVEIVLADPPVS